MKTSSVYTRVIGCKVAYMEIRRKGSRTDLRKGSVMIRDGWHWLRGCIYFKQCIVGMCLEVGDDAYVAK